MVNGERNHPFYFIKKKSFEQIILPIKVSIISSDRTFEFKGEHFKRYTRHPRNKMCRVPEKCSHIRGFNCAVINLVTCSFYFLLFLVIPSGKASFWIKSYTSQWTLCHMLFFGFWQFIIKLLKIHFLYNIGYKKKKSVMGTFFFFFLWFRNIYYNEINNDNNKRLWWTKLKLYKQ